MLKPFSTAAGALTICLLSSPVHALSFDQAWSQVNEQNQQILADQEEIKRRFALKEAAEGLYLPRIELSGLYTRFSDSVTAGVPDLTAIGIPAGALPSQIEFLDQDIWQANVVALLPVYTGGQITAANDLADAELEESRWQQKLNRQQRFLDLVQLYYGAQLSELVLATREQAENALEIHLSNAEKLLAQGMIARVEMLNAKASYEQGVVAVTRAKTDRTLAYIALRNILQATAEQSLELESPLFVSKALGDLAAYQSQTLANHPALKVLDAKGRQLDAAEKAYKGKSLPQVSLMGTYNLAKDDSLLTDTLPDWTAGVSVTIPLLHNDGSHERVQATQHQQAQLNHIRIKATQDLQLLVEQSYRQIEQAQAEYQSLASNQELAEENYSLREKAFRQGLASSVEVVDARVFLDSIRTSRLNAAYHYLLALAQISAISDQMDQFITYQLEAY